MNLLNNEQLEKIELSQSDVKIRRDKAYRIFDFAKRNLSGSGDEDIIYTNIYDAVRMACEIILLLHGYRVKKSSEGHHYLTINLAQELMDGQLKNEFQRLQKMRQKRNRFDYGNLASISETELKQAFEDARALLQKIDELIKKPRQS